MEFKGTKGKWFYKECSHQMDDENTTIHGFAGRIGHVFTTAPNHGENREEALKANALLISKAPEMLEMLKKVYDSIVMQSEIEYGSEMYFKIEDLIKEATQIK